MLTPEVIVLSVAGAVVLLVLATAIRERVKRRRIMKRLQSRPQRDDLSFGESSFSNDPERAALAARVRRVLAANLEIPLDGLRPEDKLDQDLEANLAENIELFWDLENEFGIQTDSHDPEAFEQCQKQLVTFSDLVAYVQAKLAQRPPSADSQADEPSSPVYDYAIRSIPVLCITGFVTALVGGLIQKEWALRLGTCLFLSGFAVWGLANGGGMLWEFIRKARKQGLRIVAERPWASLFCISFIIFLIWIGATFFWMMLRTAI